MAARWRCGRTADPGSPERGTTFTLQIPISTAPVAEARRATARLAHGVEEGTSEASLETRTRLELTWKGRRSLDGSAAVSTVRRQACSRCCAWSLRYGLRGAVTRRCVRHCRLCCCRWIWRLPSRWTRDRLIAEETPPDLYLAGAAACSAQATARGDGRRRRRSLPVQVATRARAALAIGDLTLWRRGHAAEPAAGAGSDRVDPETDWRAAVEDSQRAEEGRCAMCERFVEQAQQALTSGDADGAKPGDQGEVLMDDLEKK